MVAQPFQTVRHRAAGPVGGPVDGDADVSLDILDHHARRVGKPNLDPAALVLTPVRTALVGQKDRDLAQVVIGPAERETQMSFGVFAQIVGQFEALGLDMDLHEAFRSD